MVFLKLCFTFAVIYRLSGPVPLELSNLKRAGKCIIVENFSILIRMLSNRTIYRYSEQMSFRRNYLFGEVPHEICLLRDEHLKELEVDSWVECNCCTS